MRHTLFALIPLLALPGVAQEAVAKEAVAQEAGGNVTVAQDLLAVLTLRGKACAAVASHEQLGESDYLVVCTDGPRYRIYIAEGDRVEVEELPKR